MNAAVNARCRRKNIAPVLKEELAELQLAELQGRLGVADAVKDPHIRHELATLRLLQLEKVEKDAKAGEGEDLQV